MLTSALNPNVVKTALDELFFAEYNFPEHPGYASAEDSSCFMQMDSNKASEVTEEIKSSGYWASRSELAVPDEATPQSVYQQTFTNSALAKGVTISKHFMDDDQHGMWEKIVRDFAQLGRKSKDRNAFSVFRTGFSTTYGDAVALFSASHPIVGGLQSNTDTIKLTETNLNTAMIALINQKGRDGTVAGSSPTTLLVATAGYKRGCIILDSEFRSGTANNDENVYSSKYRMMIKMTPFVGASESDGDDDYWFLLARNHGITRFKRQDVQTRLIDWRQREDMSYYYSGEFRQSVGAMSYVGAWGSTGSAGSYDA